MKNKKILCFVTFGLVITVLCSSLCFSSFASSTQLARVPTHTLPIDLTGVTVTVPTGWTASAGYDDFSIQGYYSYNNINSRFDTLFIGFSGGGMPLADSVMFSPDFFDITSGSTFSFTVTGGDDADHPALIQWLADNNAFGGGSTYTINEGYYLPTSSIDITDEIAISIGIGNTLIYEMPASNGWVNNDGFTTYIDNIRFTLASANPSRTAYRIDVSYYDGYEEVLLSTFVKSSSGTVQYTSSNGFKAFYIDEPFEVDSLGNELFNGLFTYSQYEPGAPIPPPDVSSVLETFLQGVANALDTDIFGYFSILDLVKILVAASFIVWLLKMLAGG